MRKYYYNSFRGFSNEADLISVDQGNAQEVQQFDAFYQRHARSNNINWQLDQITAKRARDIARSNRGIKRTYECAGINLHCNPVGPTEIIAATEFFAEV